MPTKTCSDKLDVHLTALKRANRIEVWHDRKIPAGARWRDTTNQELERADGGEPNA